MIEEVAKKLIMLMIKVFKLINEKESIHFEFYFN